MSISPPAPKVNFLKHRSVVLTMPRLSSEAVGKALAYRYGDSSPRYSVRTTMPSLYAILWNFLRFQNYKISITLLSISNMSGDGLYQIRSKVTKSLSNSHKFFEKILYEGLIFLFSPLSVVCFCFKKIRKTKKSVSKWMTTDFIFLDEWYHIKRYQQCVSIFL